MTQEKTYNGWSNYETWNCALWIDNEQSFYADVRELAKTTTKYDLAQYIKGIIEENNPLADNATMYTDLLNAAISEINFYEIAENYINEGSKEIASISQIDD